MSVVVLRGDAAHLPLPDGSVDLIVTSPPYWAMRVYTDGGERYDGQIGDEATPGEYLEALWRCTREWMRVLKPEGSMFVDLGDKYSLPGKGERNMQGTTGGIVHKVGAAQANRSARDFSYDGTPAKSLLMLPERYRIGCVDRLGLIAREVIEWSKPNPLPESTRDRCGRTHEDVVHLVKQPRYFAALDEIREPPRRADGKMSPKERATVAAGHWRGFLPEDRENPLGKVPGSVWTIPSAPLVVPDRVAHARCCDGRKREGCEGGLAHFAAYPPALMTPIILGWSPSGICLECGEGRRPVSVADAPATRAWALAQRGGRSWHGDGTDPRRTLGATAAERNRHILGYACACTPYTDHPGTVGRERAGQGYARETGRDAHPHGGVGMLPRTGPWREYHLDRWVPPPTRPAVVLDPFAGTGTTMLVASTLGRVGVGVDRSADYCRLATWRCSDPGERARALGVPKPPKQVDGQATLFEEMTG